MRVTTRMIVRTMMLLLANYSVEAQTAQRPGPLRFRITLAPELDNRAESGRLIVLLTSRVDMDKELKPIPADTSVWVAAREVRNWKRGEAIDFNPDKLAFPAPFSKAPPGDYRAMAVLDVNHHYAYSGPYRGTNPGDLRSAVVTVRGLNPRDTAPVNLALTERTPEFPRKAPPGTELIDFVSPVLERFWGRPIHMRGVVRLPPDYSTSTKRYPAAYFLPGFGVDMGVISFVLNAVPKPPGAATPALITIILDQSCPGGNHNFSDSVNNGPWATALTTELIPYLEAKYRIDADPRRRFLVGFSSGASTALWLQVNYPQLFGGSWPMAPGATDFRSVLGIDLHASPAQNIYRDGEPWVRSLTLQGRVLGEYGGTISSLDWIYSPRGDDGRPMPLFDHDTGEVNPDVARAWMRYEISGIVRRDADRLRPLLDGKIHLTVGTKDVSLASTRLLEEALKEARIRADFVYLEGRDHNDVGRDGSNPAPGSLMSRIQSEMEATAQRTR